MTFFTFLLVFTSLFMSLKAYRLGSSNELAMKVLSEAEEERDQLRYTLGEIMGIDGEIVGKLQLLEKNEDGSYAKALPAGAETKALLPSRDSGDEAVLRAIADHDRKYATVSSVEPAVKERPWMTDKYKAERRHRREAWRERRRLAQERRLQTKTRHFALHSVTEATELYFAPGEQ